MYELKNPENNHIYLEGVVKGLVQESIRIKEIYKGLEFSVGGLPISAEELRALENMDDPLDLDYELSTPELAYANNLKRFGDVMIPPPSYTVFLKYCDENGIKVHPLDMDDDHFTMAYCKHVSGTNWIMQSFREKRLLRKTIPGDTPREFAVNWDTEINRLKGYRALEEHREEVMAKNIRRLSKMGDIFSIVEFERLDGILDKLRSANCTLFER